MLVITVLIGSGFSVGVVSVDVDSTVIAENCTFSNSIVGLGGAIGVINESKVVSQNTVFYNNTALIAGGAIFCAGPPTATLSMTDTTFEYNSANRGVVIASSTFCDIESNGLLNMKRNSGNQLGFIYAIQSQVNFSGSTVVAYNKGSIMAITSTLEISGDLTSTNNTGNKNTLSKTMTKEIHLLYISNFHTLSAGSINCSREWWWSSDKSKSTLH